MAHDPSLGFADYFSSATDATAGMSAMADQGEPDLFDLHADMELLGMRAGLPAMPASKAAVLIDAGGGADGSTNAATVRFLSDGQQHQAPLSLSLCRPDQRLVGGSGFSRHEQPEAWTHAVDYAAAPGGAAWHLRGSRFLLPTQRLLHEFCSLPVDTDKRTKAAKATQEEADGGDGSSSTWAPSPQIQAMDALELQRLRDRLYIMLEELDRRYRRYCEQMRSVAGGFEAVAGERAASAYTALASRTISRHFRNLRDGIVAQLQAARKALGEKDVGVRGMTCGETPRLRVLDQCIRQQKALNLQAGMMESQPWRPQRGLPERAVTILRAWLFEHFLHPYPSDVDKHILARQTGLSRSQVSNWFINARVRLWKPMVEEMYVEEMKGEQQHDDGGGSSGGGHVNPNPSISEASELAYNVGRQHGVSETADGGSNNGIDRKPTREQLLHDAGSLAAVVSVGSGVACAGPGGGARLVESFGVMDHLDFDAYDDDGHHQAAGGFGSVSLTLGLQQHSGSRGESGGVNIAFGAPPSSAHHGGYLFAAPGHQHMEGGDHHQYVQLGAAMDGGEAPQGQEHYRNLSAAGFHLLRDLAG